ncbi:hypothetical protein KM043_011683 [Ampulex compressa]|nr:hypothetical protein KM043_011683 [Ampulex compressa]
MAANRKNVSQIETAPGCRRTEIGPNEITPGKPPQTISGVKVTRFSLLAQTMPKNENSSSNLRAPSPPRTVPPIPKPLQRSVSKTDIIKKPENNSKNTSQESGSKFNPHRENQPDKPKGPTHPWSLEICPCEGECGPQNRGISRYARILFLLGSKDELEVKRSEVHSSRVIKQANKRRRRLEGSRKKGWKIESANQYIPR